MSVQSQIDRISGAVQSALAALTEKGVTVPAGTKVDGLADLIAAIEAGGQSIPGYDVAFGLFTPVENIAAPIVDTGWGDAPDPTKVYAVTVFGWQLEGAANVSRNISAASIFNANINGTIPMVRTYTYANSTATSITAGSSRNIGSEFYDNGTIKLYGYTNSWNFAPGHTYAWFAIREK